MRAPQDYKHLLETKGIPLRELGIQDIALEREDALLAVQFLRKASIPILGGDVYLKRGAKIELAYADWHSDPHRGEDLDRYFERSWAGTENYLRSFSQPPDAMPLFSLVVGGG